MAWIKTVNFSDADEKLVDYMRRMRQTLPPEYATPAPKASKSGESIVETHTLIPDAMYHAFMTMSSLMVDDLPLSRRQQEMIATIVSEKNDCHY